LEGHLDQTQQLIQELLAPLEIGLQHYQSQKQEDINQVGFLLMLKVEDVRLVRGMV
jgi:hypothetical protein